MTQPCNVAAHLPSMAQRVPEQPAIVVTSRRRRDHPTPYRLISFAELEAITNRYAGALRASGIEPGMRTLVMVRPGITFIALMFAMFKAGIVPVLIDPGMGIGRLLECVRSVTPRAFVGIPLAHVVRLLRRRAFRHVEIAVTVGRAWGWRGPTLDAMSARASDTFETVSSAAHDTAAILFTSGATGVAKGVVYEHGMFDAQVRLIRDHYGMAPGEIDLPGFPLFALFNPAMGMTSVIPDMDAAHPARVDPVKIVRAIQDWEVTNTFGSPAMWKRVSDHCIAKGIVLPTLRRVLVAGAPVPIDLVHRVRRMLGPDADVHTPYGATESLPVTSISGRDRIASVQRNNQREDSDSTSTSAASASDLQPASDAQQVWYDSGICVGRPLPGMDVYIIRITDEPIAQWSDELQVAPGEPGEIVVAGPVVTKRYADLEDETHRAKIGHGRRVLHRIGDIGRIGARGRLWYYGRKAHRVRTQRGLLFTIPVESIFNQHPAVLRSALVGVGQATGAIDSPVGPLDQPVEQLPVVVVELYGERLPRKRDAITLQTQLRDLAAAHEYTATIERFLFRRRLPVDIRHNAKINREALAVWAASRSS